MFDPGGFPKLEYDKIATLGIYPNYFAFCATPIAMLANSILDGF